MWSKRREPDAAHDDNDNELRGVERDDCGDEAAACTAAVAAAAENMLLQLDAGLEDSTLLFCDGLFDSGEVVVTQLDSVYFGTDGASYTTKYTKH